MPAFTIKHLTRDSFIVEFDGFEYNVDGERYGDGRWEIFPKMVYQRMPDDTLSLVEDEQLRAAIVAALREHWPEYGYPWTLI
ncbi:MAG: hypothetical protein KJO38_12060 [Gammaproteobacteria bacterium]|nr:hypothetical protein [Gammaproteobacteria bacterium]